MIRLRPHHLLCFQSYVGRGYSSEFRDNMDRVYRQLKSRPGQAIEIIFGLDEICRFCPSNIGNEYCESQEKVAEIDRKTIEFLDLKERAYIYEDLLSKIYEILRKDDFHSICSECQWYEDGICQEVFKNKLKD